MDNSRTIVINTMVIIIDRVVTALTISLWEEEMLEYETKGPLRQPRKETNWRTRRRQTCDFSWNVLSYYAGIGDRYIQGMFSVIAHCSEDICLFLAGSRLNGGLHYETTMHACVLPAVVIVNLDTLQGLRFALGKAAATAARRYRPQ